MSLVAWCDHCQRPQTDSEPPWHEITIEKIKYHLCEADYQEMVGIFLRNKSVLAKPPD